MLYFEVSLLPLFFSQFSLYCLIPCLHIILIIFLICHLLSIPDRVYSSYILYTVFRSCYFLRNNYSRTYTPIYKYINMCKYLSFLSFFPFRSISLFLSFVNKFYLCKYRNAIFVNCSSSHVDL